MWPSCRGVTRPPASSARRAFRVTIRLGRLASPQSTTSCGRVAARHHGARASNRRRVDVGPRGVSKRRRREHRCLCPRAITISEESTSHCQYEGYGVDIQRALTVCRCRQRETPCWRKSSTGRSAADWAPSCPVAAALVSRSGDTREDVRAPVSGRVASVVRSEQDRAVGHATTCGGPGQEGVQER